MPAARGVIRSTLVLMGSSVVSQALLIGFSPVLTRLYSPSEFGLFGSYAALAMALVVVAGLRFEAAIPLVTDDGEALQLLMLSIGCGVATSVAVAVGVLFFGDDLAATLRLPGLNRWLWLLPATVATGAAYQALTYWHVRKVRFGGIARTNVAQSSSNLSMQVTMGLAASGPGGLFVGDLAARVVGCLALGRLVIHEARGRTRALTLSVFRSVALRHKRFPLIASFASLANMVTIYLPAPLFAAFYGASEAGGVVLAQRVVSLPASMLAAGASQVFLGEAARLAKEDPRRTLPFLRFAATRLSVCALGFSVGGALLLPHLFQPVFGERWAEAGEFSRILCFSAGAGLIVSPISQVVFIAGREGLQFVADAARLGLVAVAITAAHLAWPESAIAGVTAYALAMTAAYVAFFGFYYSCARRVAGRQS